MTRSPFMGRGDRGRRRGADAWLGLLLVALVAVATAAALLATGVVSWSDVTGGGASAGAGGGGARGVAAGGSPADARTRVDAGARAARTNAGLPVAVHFHHPPRSGLLFDLHTGRVLWQRQPTRVLPIASLTKMMTALIVVSHARSDEEVLITPQALAYQGSGMGVLPRGKHVELETLLYGLLLPSGNDAAIALAQHVGGTVERFLRLMNARARSLRLRCTHYTSPDGFLNSNVSCADDLARLAKVDLEHARIARIVRTPEAVLPLPIKAGKVYLYNNNYLLRIAYPGADGLKTGETNAAGLCLVATARRGRVHLGLVLLHSPDPPSLHRQAVALLDAGFRAEARGLRGVHGGRSRVVRVRGA